MRLNKNTYLHYVPLEVPLAQQSGRRQGGLIIHGIRIEVHIHGQPPMEFSHEGGANYRVPVRAERLEGVEYALYIANMLDISRSFFPQSLR